ncbi:MAG: citrate lyase subunit beta / citryl-CoA lyase [Solirubrobacteraceae bacterium]|jgi:citrate lyase subunit beta/citryl-CoA lyase|nr:citrate lyase subunit beta / citryl-CoA lyase [Solirubrobacteraceae bacterium]
MGHPVRRSCLSVPGSSERKIQKALTLEVDEVIFDLEDAVVLAAKDQARADVLAALAANPDQADRIAVRVNAPGSPWCHLDLIALAAADVPPASVILPKTESPDDIAFVDRLLAGVEAGAQADRPVSIQALIETAAGLLWASEIAGASGRLESLILGYADLSVSLGRRPPGPAHPDGSAWDGARDAVVLAAKASGLQAIDGPYLGVAVDDHFTAAATRARELGFDGKWAIHPAQVGSLNEIFTPSDEDVARAREIVAALEKASDGDGAGAVALDGAMLDEALRQWALGVLASAARAAGPAG